jgi:coenzyme F420-0:L-glutamate ligase/coenzyme F420-1:gamma-L-glutamate ligase
MDTEIFTNEQLAFIQTQRVARLATADRAGQPHVVPVCFAIDNNSLYTALDDKPKRVEPWRLKRVRNILQNPQVALVLDHYSEDWSDLAYVLIRGTADLLDVGQEEHQRAIFRLRDRYEQYCAMSIEEQPVIAIRPTSVVAWGAVGQLVPK